MFVIQLRVSVPTDFLLFEKFFVCYTEQFGEELDVSPSRFLFSFYHRAGRKREKAGAFL